MGVVWRARHEALGRTFALKLLRPETAADPPARARFAREAEALGRLRHPHIVTVTDFGVDERDGAPYLVMEHLAGAPLSQRLEAGPLPPPEAITILRAVAAGVDAAHEAGVLHRDLKPANVLLGEAVVKVLDFGLAHLAHGAAADTAPSPGAAEGDARLTGAGTLVGTPLYIAPELIRDPRAASPASDVYAFTAMAWEVLAGRPPFDGTIGQVLEGHLHRPPIAPGTSPLPPGVWEALREGLAKDAASRPRLAVEVVARIEESLRRHEAGRRDARRRRRGAGWSVAVTAAAVLLALGPLRPLLAGLERRSVDLRFRLAAPVSPDPRLLIVALDDAGVPGVSTLADAGDVVAPVLDQALSAGARGVALDLLLPRKWSESPRFSELLLRHPDRITLAAYSDEEQAVIGTECVAGLTAVALGPERTAALFGYVNLYEDADGVTRRARATFRDVAGRSRPSWAAAAYRRLEPQPISGGLFWIDHRLRVHDLPRMDWSEAAHLAATRPETFRDRLLLVGIGPAASGDDVHRVVRPSRSVRGVAGLGLQALIVDTMARGRPVRDASPTAFQAVAVLAAGVLAGGWLCYGRTTWVLPAAAIVTVVYGWTAVAALDRAGLLLPVATPVTIVALGLLLSAGARALDR
jgi:CHASE2 domain-containing sensor protein